MKFWLSLVNVAEVDQFVDIARFAEEVGFHGITVADHLVMPMKYESKYPYTPDGKTWWPDDLPWADPWVALTAMGTATTKLELATNIYLLGLRDPFTAAKAMGTAAVLTGGRLRCGIGSGWIREEYELVGVDFASRGRRIDEMIEVMRKLWSGKVVSHHGEFFDFDDALMSPVPAKPVPILVGGASKPALRRAARNNGWFGTPMVRDAMLATIRELHRLREERGEPQEPFEIFFSLLGMVTPDLAAELEALGASDTSAMPWMETPWGRMPWLHEGEDPSSLDVKKRVMERYAKDVIEPLG